LPHSVQIIISLPVIFPHCPLLFRASFH
jgi:hypothetical protein